MGKRIEGNNLKPRFAKWGNPDLHLDFSNPGASLSPNPIREYPALQGSLLQLRPKQLLLS